MTAWNPCARPIIIVEALRLVGGCSRGDELAGKNQASAALETAYYVGIQLKNDQTSDDTKLLLLLLKSRLLPDVDLVAKYPTKKEELTLFFVVNTVVRGRIRTLSISELYNTST